MLSRLLSVGSQQQSAEKFTHFDRLLERVRGATLTDDRRVAVNELRDVMKDAPLDLGDKGCFVLLEVLQNHRNDSELVCATLETLLNCIDDGTDDATSNGVPACNAVCIRNTECLVKDVGNVGLFINLLEESDMFVRLNTVQLLTVLLGNKSRRLQEAIISTAGAISKLMDSLRDRDEIIRNEVLLLFQALTKGNRDIQKIVAFEGAFERLFEIVQEEGLLEGNVIVQDCLRLLVGLLRGNSSNQAYFRETGCVQFLPELFQIRVTNLKPLPERTQTAVFTAIEVAEQLLAGEGQDLYAAQTALGRARLPELFFLLALLPPFSPRVHSKALLVARQIIEGHTENIASIPPVADDHEAAFFRLLKLALDGKEWSERFAASSFFEAYLKGSSTNQIEFAKKLSPYAKNGHGERNAFGSLLTTTLFGSGVLGNVASTWAASCIFSAIIYSNDVCKEMVVQGPLEMPRNDALGQPETCLLRIVRTVKEAVRQQSDVMVRVAFLRIVVLFLDASETAIRAFLQSPSNLPIIVELATKAGSDPHTQGLAAFTVGLCLEYSGDMAPGEMGRPVILDIIKNRIGMDVFFEKLSALQKSEAFQFAEQGKRLEDDDHRALVTSNQTLLFYDQTFTRGFRVTHDKIKQRIVSMYAPGNHVNLHAPRPSRAFGGTPPPSPPPAIIQPSLQLPSSYSSSSTSPPITPSLPQPETLLQSYKDVIQNQEHELANLRSRTRDLEQRMAIGSNGPLSTTPNHCDSTQHEMIAQLQRAVGEKEMEVSNLKKEVASLRIRNKEVEAKYEAVADSVPREQYMRELKAVSETYNRLELEYDNLQRSIAEKEGKDATRDSTSGSLQESAGLDAEVKQLTLEVERLRREGQEGDAKLAEQHAQLKALQEDHEDLLACLGEMDMENAELRTTLERLTATQDGED